jgi:hypothetical protein
MKIEVLYVPGCPNHKPALEAVTNVLALESFETEISEVPVRSEGEAHALRFPGSPTIRATLSMTQSLRTLLAGQGVTVHGS